MLSTLASSKRCRPSSPSILETLIQAWALELEPAERFDLLELFHELSKRQSTPEAEDEASRMLIDWQIREFTPAWIELIPEARGDAEVLRNLPPLSKSTQAIVMSGLMDVQGRAAELNRVHHQRLLQVKANRNTGDPDAIRESVILDACERATVDQVVKAWKATGKTALDAAFEGRMRQEITIASNVSRWIMFRAAFLVAQQALKDASTLGVDPFLFEEVPASSVEEFLAGTVAGLQSSLAAWISSMVAARRDVVA